MVILFKKTFCAQFDDHKKLGLQVMFVTKIQLQEDENIGESMAIIE